MAAACVTVVLVFFFARMISPDGLVAICSTAVFAMTPVFAVHGIAAYAEPLSNMVVTVGILAYLRYVYAPPTDRTRLFEVAALCTWTLALLFATVVKRENLVLAFVLPFVSILRITARCDQTTTWRRVGIASLGSGIAIAFCLVSLRFGDALRNETAEFHRIPFGLAQARGLLPAFLTSFRVTPWYCLGLLWVLVGLFFVRRSDYRTLYPAVVIIAYLTLYVSHVRSYYQINAGDVTPADALRYAMNFMTLWALLAGAGLASVIRKWVSIGDAHRWKTISVTAALIIYAATAYQYTTTLRDQATSEERHTRIEPAIAVAQLARTMSAADTYIITLEPLVLQLYAPPSTNVIDLTRVDDQLLATLASQHEHLNLLYLDNATYRNPIDQERYQPQLKALNRGSHEAILQTKQFDIIKLQLPAL